MQLSGPPFSILALAPFAATISSKPRLVSVDLESLDQAVADLSPSLRIPVDKALCPEGGLELTLTAYRDLRPDRLIACSPYLTRVHEAARAASAGESAGTPQVDLAADLGRRWPDVPLEAPAAKAIPTPRAGVLDDIFAMVAAEGHREAEAAQGPGSLAAQARGRLGALLAAVYDHPDFKAMESAWRGLETLLVAGPVKAAGGITVTLAPISTDHLEGILEALTEAVAAEPPDLILVDLPLDNSTVSVGRLEKILELADALTAPTVAGIGPAFFGLPDWSGFGRIQYLKHFLEEAAYAKWRKLKEHPGAAWTALTVNRYLARPAYGPDNRIKAADLTEAQPCWIGPAWAVGGLAVRSIGEYGWPSRLTDYIHVYLGDRPLTAGPGGMSPVELVLAEDRLLEFIDVGMSPVYGPIRKDQVFWPKETTLAGGAMKFMMFTARVLRFMYWLRENPAEAGIEGGDPAPGVTAALARIWERTGRPAPEDLSVTAGPRDDYGRVPLTIAMTPSTAILPGGQKLEFQYAW